MKTKSYLLSFIFFSQLFFSQYMIVGKDTLKLENFKKEYQYGLQNSGIDKTISTTQDFLLLQQFAMEKRADTMSYFKNRVAQRESELREQYFYPRAVIDPLLNEYVSANKTERQILVFMVEKKPEDKTDYKKVYEEVKAGKLKMEDAISQYMKTESKPLYIKPGGFDNQIYTEITKLNSGGYTKLYDMPGFVAFVKYLGSRPSLGYMIFGTISYPNDANAEKTKTNIYKDLSSGKKFPEVAKLYGSTEDEKNNGGLVMGSPTLPDEVYNALKGKKTGDYSQPVLINDKFFVFNIYSLEPYEITEKSKPFFEKEMMKSIYSEVAFDKLIDYLKQSGYKEFADFQVVKKSYQNLSVLKNDQAQLLQYGNKIFTVGELKKMLSEKVKDADKMPSEQWQELIKMISSQFVYHSYSDNFTNLKDIKPDLDNLKRNLYSEYIFSEYLKKEVEKHPEWLTDYYNKNKSKYIWDNRAKGRVAIILDEKLIPEIKKEMENANNWDALQKKYDGKLNDKKQLIVHFETGNMSKDAEVFTKYGVTFSKGLYTTKMEDKNLVIAIDDILPPTQMTQKEAEELITDAVTEQKLNETIAQQRAKTKIVVQPEFIKGLEQNFKK